MSTVKTGSETLSYCSSCKMDLYATVVAMSGSQILRVMCKTCKKERSYKAPKGVKEPGAPGNMERATGTKSGTAKAKAKPAAPKPTAVAIAVEWKTALDKAVAAKVARQAYLPKNLFSPGQIVDHPSFGPGVVTKLVHPNKVEILFQNDLKVLVHGLGAK